MKFFRGLKDFFVEFFPLSLLLVIFIVAVAGGITLAISDGIDRRARIARGETDPALIVSTCPPGYLLHSGDRYTAPGKVCVPGVVPTQELKSDELHKAGRQ